MNGGVSVEGYCWSEGRVVWSCMVQRKKRGPGDWGIESDEWDGKKQKVKRKTNCSTQAYLEHLFLFNGSLLDRWLLLRTFHSL